MSYEVGVARVDITPPPEWIAAGRIWLWGYGTRHAPCTGVRDPLEVRALAIRDGDGAMAVVVTLDLGALHPSSTERIRGRVTAAQGIAGEYICVNVSHTHNAPVFVSILTWQPGVDHADDGYVVLVEDAAVAAVALAVADLRPATLAFGRSATALTYDRRPTGAPMDATLDVVRACAEADGATIAVVFTTAGHPVCRRVDNLVSSDFVGPAREAIETAAGGTALFVQGYGGTCNAAGDDADATGAAMGGEVAAVLAGPMDMLAGPLDAWASTVELPLQPIAPGAVAANIGRADEVGRWARWMKVQGAAVPATLPTPLQAIRIGTGRDAWYLAASGHEVVMDLAAAVRDLWPYRRVTTAAYCNSQLSYLPGRRVLQAPACGTFPDCVNYEGGSAFVWYGHRGPLTLEAEDRFLHAHVQLLDVGWVPVGHATSVVGLASWGDRLYAATANDFLWWRPAIADGPGGVVPWRSMGHAIGVCGLAACDGALYAATTDGKLWKRALYGVDRPWTHIGHAQQVAALTAMDGRLFAATKNDRLWRRDPVDRDVAWEDLGHAQQVAGLATFDGILLAATHDGGLHWRRPFAGNLGWRRYGHAQDVVGMTAVGDMLYAATAAGTLWRRPV